MNKITCVKYCTLIKNIKWLLFLGIWLVFAGNTLSFNNSGVGYSGASFLRISSAARQVAMGEASTALADDINLMRYNIGGLGQLNTEMLAANYHNWLDDTQQGSFALALPYKYGIVGIDFTYFNEGKIDEVDEQFRQTGGTVSGDDFLFNVGYGSRLRIWDYIFSVGSSFKFLRQTLAGQHSTAVGIDLGTQFHYKSLLFGATIQNIGLSRVKFRDISAPLPTTFRLGTAAGLGKSESLHINVAGDVSWTMKENLRYYIGGELTISDLLSLRTGYQFHDVAATPLSAGFGLKIPMEWLAGSKTRLDYSYSPMDVFETDIHRFSLLFVFGAAKKTEDYNRMLQDELEAARRSRIALQKLEDEMARRLARAKQIAAESEGKIEVEQKGENKVLVSMRINFDFDKSDIRKADYNTINQASDILGTYPEAKIHVSGHTDSIGTDWYNIRLSQRRIESVIKYLKTEKNFADDKFYMPIGYGELRPVADNGTEEGRARNRRVEFMLFTFDSKPELPDGSALRTVLAVDDRTINIVCNGKVGYSVKTLSSPDRLIIDIPNIYMLSDVKEIELNRGPFIRARLGFHRDGPFTRVVFDLNRMINVDVSARENLIVVRAQ